MGGQTTLVSLINIDWIIRDHLRLSAISCLDLPSPGLLGFPYFVSLVHNILVVRPLLTCSIQSTLDGASEEQDDDQEASILTVYCDALCTYLHDVHYIIFIFPHPLETVLRSSVTAPSPLISPSSPSPGRAGLSPGPS